MLKPDEERITFQQWDAAASRVFNKNIKEHGHSLSPVNIQRRAYYFIVDVRSCENTMVVRKGWRQAMKKGETEFQANHPVGSTISGTFETQLWTGNVIDFEGECLFILLDVPHPHMPGLVGTNHQLAVHPDALDFTFDPP